LLRHPEVTITSVTGRSYVGQKLGEAFPYLADLDLTILEGLSGKALPRDVRLMTPFFNSFGTLALVGGALRDRVTLLVSVGIRPRLDADRLPLLGLAAARAVLIACRQAAPGVALAVRWPNDVVSAEGRKLAGVLAEAASEAGQPPEVILGMGINTNWQRAEMPDEIAVSATSLREVTAAAVNRVALLGDLLEALDRGVAELEAGGSPVPALRADAWLDGKLVEVEAGERRVRGTVTGLRDDGALLLLTDDGPVALQVGEVVRVASAGSAGVAA